MAIDHRQEGDHAGDEVAVEEEADLGGVAEDRPVGIERELVGQQPRRQREDLGVRLQRAEEHPEHREAREHEAGRQPEMDEDRRHQGLAEGTSSRHRRLPAPSDA